MAASAIASTDAGESICDASTCGSEGSVGSQNHVVQKEKASTSVHPGAPGCTLVEAFSFCTTWFCDPTDPSDPHVLASQMLSPASVDAIADAAILFVRAHLGRGHGLERRRSGAELRRGASYGPFGSFTGLDGLTRPFPF